jgi:hypothetical protein
MQRGAQSNILRPDYIRRPGTLSKTLFDFVLYRFLASVALPRTCGK